MFQINVKTAKQGHFAIKIFTLVCLAVFVIGYIRTHQFGMSVTWEFWALASFVLSICVWLLFISYKKVEFLAKKEIKEVFE